MAERLLISLVIFGGLAIAWLAWQYYKAGLARRIRPAERGTGVPTLLYFRADYCAPCRLRQTPVVNRLSARLGQAINVKTYDVAQHPELARRYKVLTLPATVVLDEQGRVAHVNYGVTDEAKLAAQLGQAGGRPFPAGLPAS